MDITLVGILIGAFAFLAVLVFLMCRDAAKESWLQFSTESRRQMQEKEGKKEIGAGALAKIVDIVFAPIYAKKQEEKKEEKKGIWNNYYVKIALFSFGIYVLLFAYFFFASKPAQFEISYFEGGLQKNAQLQLASGQYAYQVGINGSFLNVSYVVSKSPACSGYIVTGNDGKSSLCIGKDGAVFGEKAQNNLTASQSGVIYLYAPWMLAVGDGWEWKVDVVALEKNSGMNYSSSVEYAHVGNVSMLGRNAYKVEVRNTGGLPSYVFVDAQTRVMLLQNSTLGEIKLVKAPFLSK